MNRSLFKFYDFHMQSADSLLYTRHNFMVLLAKVVIVLADIFNR